MKYTVLDVAEVVHGDPIKLVGTITDAGLDSIRDPDAGLPCERKESGIVWISDEGHYIAVPHFDDTTWSHEELDCTKEFEGDEE